MARIRLAQQTSPTETDMRPTNLDAIMQYLASSARLSSLNEARAMAGLSEVIPIVESIAANLSFNSRSRSGSVVRISVDSGENRGRPASAQRNRIDDSFDIVVTAAFLHRLYNQTQKIEKLQGRKYSPSAFVVFAASAALCHEFAHVVMGHLQDRERPPEHVVRADEVSADFRAGVLMLGLFQSRRYKQLLQETCKVRTAHDFVESSLIGIASLCTVLQTLHRDSDSYHRPAVRVSHFMAGFLSIVTRTKFMVEPQVKKRYLTTLAFLREIGWSFDDPLALNTVMSGDVKDEERFWNETAALMDVRVPLALNRSPLLAPHRDRLGPFV